MSAAEVKKVIESLEKHFTLWADRQTCKNYYFDYEEPVYKWATGPTNCTNVPCEKTPTAVRPKFKKGDDKRPPCIITCPNGNIVHYQDSEDFYYINQQQAKKASNPLNKFVTSIRRV
jgi:hypothetical protein